MEVVIVYDGEMPLRKLFISQVRINAPLQQQHVANHSERLQENSPFPLFHVRQRQLRKGVPHLLEKGFIRALFFIVRHNVFAG
jgi:hypothetical protein